MTPIRLAVVDDSAFVRKAIRRMLEIDSRLEIVGTAASGEELLLHLEAWKPDVITLDLSMPGIGGLVTLDRIIALGSTPVIILSTHAGSGAPQTIEALHRGAIDFIDKQRYSLLDFDSLREVLVAKILAVHHDRRPVQTGEDSQPDRTSPRVSAREKGCSIVFLGASTGGPPAIEAILRDLGENLGVPIVVAQHMPPDFTAAFARRLDSRLPIRVAEATSGERLSPGSVLIAPGGSHLLVQRDGKDLRALLTQEPADVAHHPSVDVLFSSGARTVGSDALAILLTGMGRDGAIGLGEIAALGGHTIVQDESTSVVWGMPAAAVELGAAAEVLPLGRIGRRVIELTRAKK